MSPMPLLVLPRYGLLNGTPSSKKKLRAGKLVIIASADGSEFVELLSGKRTIRRFVSIFYEIADKNILRERNVVENETKRNCKEFEKL